VPSSSWALTISLSAIASALTVNLPSRIAAEMRSTLAASKTPSLLPPASATNASDSWTLALASVPLPAAGVEPDLRSDCAGAMAALFSN